MVIFEDKSIVFVHIPKTAGSSIRHALIEAGGLSTAKTAGTKHETSEQLLAKLDQYPGLLKSSSTKSRVAAFFRIPNRRIATHIRFAMFVRNPVDRIASLHRYLLSTQLVNYPMTPTDPDEFVDCVIQSEEWTRPIRSLRPQCNYLPKNNSVWIGKYENLSSDFKLLCDLLGIEAKLPHLNSTGKPKETKGVFSTRSIQQIKEYYEQDFIEFGYV